MLKLIVILILRVKVSYICNGDTLKLNYLTNCNTEYNNNRSILMPNTNSISNAESFGNTNNGTININSVIN